MAACLSRYWWDAFGCAARAPYLRSIALARSASLRSHALVPAMPWTFPSRLFAPLSRLRERGGGEGRRIHEVNRINSCVPAPSPEFDEKRAPTATDDRLRCDSDTLLDVASATADLTRLRGQSRGPSGHDAGEEWPGHSLTDS
ncbi:hypothetical protein CBM2623_B30025 [Cupriavidus taiwanensis]|nr:hypothetical protein CBM2608_B30025 [Cupriavidus taiwanensis]SPA34378.1 hypothetical protein CBM2623_B30025 [Cupriavidus taiwanensis]